MPRAAEEGRTPRSVINLSVFSWCLAACISAPTFGCIHIYIYIYPYEYEHIYMRIRIHVHINVCVYIYIYIYTYIHIHVYVYMKMCLNKSQDDVGSGTLLLYLKLGSSFFGGAGGNDMQGMLAPVAPLAVHRRGARAQSAWPGRILNGVYKKNVVI